YEIGEYVKISIPKIDRFDTDRPILPCRILNKLNHNDTFKYRLGCKDGILNNLYCAGEMEPLGVREFSELENIPTDYISVREAARSQNSGTFTGTICKCKGSCSTNKCHCKKASARCGSKCHSGNTCDNKAQI
ncbi:13168_t:CDS:1, partial [Racocetra persica]